MLGSIGGGDDNNWGVPYFPKTLFPLYLTDLKVLFEKQSHYPLILIGNCNL